MCFERGEFPITFSRPLVSLTFFKDFFFPDNGKKPPYFDNTSFKQNVNQTNSQKFLLRKYPCNTYTLVKILLLWMA